MYRLYRAEMLVRIVLGDANRGHGWALIVALAGEAVNEVQACPPVALRAPISAEAVAAYLVIRLRCRQLLDDSLSSTNQ